MPTAKQINKTRWEKQDWNKNTYYLIEYCLPKNDRTAASLKFKYDSTTKLFLHPDDNVGLKFTTDTTSLVEDWYWTTLSKIGHLIYADMYAL